MPVGNLLSPRKMEEILVAGPRWPVVWPRGSTEPVSEQPARPSPAVPARGVPPEFSLAIGMFGRPWSPTPSLKTDCKCPAYSSRRRPAWPRSALRQPTAWSPDPATGLALADDTAVAVFPSNSIEASDLDRKSMRESGGEIPVISRWVKGIFW